MPQVRRFAFVTTLVGVLLLTGINSAAFAQAETAGHRAVAAAGIGGPLLSTRTSWLQLRYPHRLCEVCRRIAS